MPKEHCEAERRRAHICNLCGQSCTLREEPEFTESGGLIEARVSGGYFSTPGNGEGALDDCTAYEFSLCEFCLDWLFSRFVVPVKTSDYMHGSDKAPWLPAAERVRAADWRHQKDKFYAAAAERARTRRGEGT